MLIPSIFSSAVFEENPRYCYSLGVMVVVVLNVVRRRFAKALTFCNISYYCICLKFGIRVHCPKSNQHYQGRQFKMHFFFFRIMPLCRLRRPLTFCTISITGITEDIYLKFGMRVRYPKSNPCY